VVSRITRKFALSLMFGMRLKFTKTLISSVPYS